MSPLFGGGGELAANWGRLMPSEMDMVGSARLVNGEAQPDVLIGVIIPCFNQGRFLADCVASLEAQTITAWKAVIVDDASNDGDTRACLEDIESEKVRVVWLPRNGGVSRARREGVRQLGEAPFLLTLDADDYIEERFLEKLLEAFERDETIGAAYGTQHAFGESAERPSGWTWPSQAFDWGRRFDEMFVPEAGVLFRTEALIGTAGWRDEFASYAEGWDLVLQLVDLGWQLAWVRDAVYHYRRHQAAVIENWNSVKSARVDALLAEFHASGIEKTVGMRKFLNRRVVPAARAALRVGDWRRAWSVLAPPIRRQPFRTLQVLASAYLRRLPPFREHRL